jgi:hypothetical protein
LSGSGPKKKERRRITGYDVPACERLAAQTIAEESGNPDLGDSTPKFSCWNASKSKRIHPRQQKPVRGSVEL